MCTASSAILTCGARASASEYTATVAIPIARAVRITRQAISPRLAMRILENKLVSARRPVERHGRTGGVLAPVHLRVFTGPVRRHIDGQVAACGILDRFEGFGRPHLGAKYHGKGC